MTLPVIALAAALFYNVVPDCTDDDSNCAAEAAAWAESVGGGTALYTFRLPGGWSQNELGMSRPLSRVKRFCASLRDSAAEPGVLLLASPEDREPVLDAALSNRLGRIGAGIAATGARFVMVDGLFSGFTRDASLFCARALRAGFDSVDPQLAAGFAMTADKRACAREIARILAGEGREPVVRIDNAVCLERTLKELPFTAAATQAKTAYAGEREVWHLDDADTSPHNLWSRSAATMQAKFAVSLFAGARGGMFWYVGQRSADGYPVNSGYSLAMARDAAFFRTLAADCAVSSPLGIALPVSSNDLGAASANWGEFAFGSFGIPFRMTYGDFGTNSPVCAIMGSDATAQFNDDELRRIFRGRVLVDGDAALALTARGLSGLLGVSAAKGELDYNCERLAGGGFIRLARSASVPLLEPLAPEAEVYSELVRRRGTGERYESVAPACVIAENELGGTVAVTAYNCRLEPWNIWNEARRDAIVDLLERLNRGPLEVRVESDQDLLVLTRRQSEKTLVLVVNLGFDPVLPRLRTARRNPETERLGRDGKWHAYVPAELPCGGFEVLRF